MLGLRLRGRPGPIGLDVGSEGVKLLQLRRSGGKISVAAAAHSRFPQNSSGPDSDPAARIQLATQAVRDAISRGGFRGRNTVSCLRSDELAIKNVRLPHMPDPELTKAVVWECQERFGFAVAPDQVHYFNAGEVRQGPEVRDEVIMMAVSDETIQRHLEMLEQMQLRPLHVDAEPSALFRTYRRYLRRAEDASTVSVIVDIGLSSTKVIVARGRTVLLIRSFDIAGESLNQSVAKELGLSYGEAVNIRGRLRQSKAAASETPGQVELSVVDAIRGQVEALAQEIGLCLRYCSVTFRGLRPGQITLTGGEAYDSGLIKLLGECLDRPCEVGQPLRGVRLGRADMGGDRRGVLTEWSVVTGLALRGLLGQEDIWNADRSRSRLSA